MKRWVSTESLSKVSLFLDSGAFSAWKQGVGIDIHDYIDFIKQYEDVIDVYANLDVIGLEGEQPNETTARMTLENQEIMEEAGLSPLPCFHFGEPFEYLDFYAEHYDYLALGVAGNTGLRIAPWLDKCFSDHICGEDGFPEVKVHGFAVTHPALILRYPFYSVDSTTWIYAGRVGDIFVPRPRDGRWVFDETPWRINVSSRNKKTEEAGKHIDTLPPRQAQVVLNYIHDSGYKLGKSRYKKVPQSYEPKDDERWAERVPKDSHADRLLEITEEAGVSNSYQKRLKLNTKYFIDLEAAMPEYPWPFKGKQVRGFDL